MVTRTIMAFVALASITSGSLFAQEHTPGKVGALLVLEMTGDVAREYAKRTRSIKGDGRPAGLEISTSAIVAQQLDDGRIRVEHTSHIVRDGNSVRLVTLSAIVDSTAVKTHVIPKGTAISSSPTTHKNGEEPGLTGKETRAFRLRLSEFKGLKLRSWTLADEIGD